MKVAAAILGVITLIVVSTMGWIGKEVVLASAVSGQLIDRNGEPVAHQTVTREWNWKGTKDEQVTTTDEAGNFTFDAVTDKMFWGAVFPHEPVVGITIRTEVNGTSKDLFGVTKHDYEHGGEWSGTETASSNPELLCDIDAEPGDEGLFWGTCVERPQ